MRARRPRLRLNREGRATLLARFHGRCAYCGRPIDPSKQWSVDHVQPIYRGWTDEDCAKAGVVRGADELHNLAPACGRCNTWKSANPLEVFRSEIAAQIQRLRRYSPSFRMAEDFGIVLAPAGVGVQFAFEVWPPESVHEEVAA